METMESRVNGVANLSGRKGRKTAAVKAPSAGQRTRAVAAGKAVWWAEKVTACSIGLSAFLNGWAAQHDSGREGWETWGSAAIGASIPLFCWGLAKVTGWTARAGRKRLAMATGAIAACVLALSVVHVAAALSAWTGTGWVLAGLFAIGIDAGMVSSEATAIMVSTAE